MSSRSKLYVFGRVAVYALLAAACGSSEDDGPAPLAEAPGGGAPLPSVEAPSQPAATQAPSTAPAAPVTATPSAPVSEGGPMPVAVAPSEQPAASPTGATPTEEPAAGEEAEPAAPVAEIEPPVGPEPDAATRMRCTGTDPIACHFGGQPGNYEVTVVLGGPAAAKTAVRAETRRGMLPIVSTAAGETRRFSFSVNVRQPEGEPIQAVPAGTPGLDVYFAGIDGVPPALESIGFRAAVSPVVIYVAGDSTVADQTGVAFGGWGQQLPQHFSFPVVVANYSDSGESSGSFLNAGPLFGAIESKLTAKDFVLIQFGHNDKTVTAAAFHDNITRLVTRVKAKGASPVLITPVSRAQFNGDQVSRQHINSTGANLPELVKQVATEQSVPLLDMTTKTTEWLQEIGPNGWQAFHANGTDVTHTNDPGAVVEAEFVRDLLIENDVAPLVSLLR